MDREGFAVLRHRSVVRNFYDEEELRTVSYPEAERLIAEATGADRVFIFDYTVRRRVPGATDRADLASEGAIGSNARPNAPITELTRRPQIIK